MKAGFPASLVLQGRVARRIARLTLRARYHSALWMREGSDESLLACAKLLKRCDTLREVEGKFAARGSA